MMCLCKIGLFFLWCSRFFFRSSYHMQFKWKYDFREYFLVIYFQPKCFVPLPIPPSFRFVHVLPAGTRGVSHMVRHCHWSVRLDGGMADWGLLYLSRGHHTHQSPKSKKKIKLCALINICWKPISVGWTTKLISDLWTAVHVSNNKLFEYEDNLRWIYIWLKLLFWISPQKLMPTKIMETTIHMYYNICFMLKEVTPCLGKYMEFTTCRICF